MTFPAIARISNDLQDAPGLLLFQQQGKSTIGAAIINIDNFGIWKIMLYHLAYMRKSGAKPLFFIEDRDNKRKCFQHTNSVDATHRGRGRRDSSGGLP